MANDNQSIGEKLRSFDEHARQSQDFDIRENRAATRDPAEGARDITEDARNRRSQNRSQQTPPPNTRGERG